MSVELKRAKVSLPVETGVASVLVLVSIWLARTFPGFRTGDNVSVILSSGAEVAIVAAGMTLVIATGGIDISRLNPTRIATPAHQEDRLRAELSKETRCPSNNTHEQLPWPRLLLGR